MTFETFDSILRLFDKYSYVFLTMCSGAIVFWFYLFYAEIMRKLFPPSTKAIRFWRGNVKIEKAKSIFNHSNVFN